MKLIYYYWVVEDRDYVNLDGKQCTLKMNTIYLSEKSFAYFTGTEQSQIDEWVDDDSVAMITPQELNALLTVTHPDSFRFI